MSAANELSLFSRVQETVPNYNLEDFSECSVLTYSQIRCSLVSCLHSIWYHIFTFYLVTHLCILLGNTCYRLRSRSSGSLPLTLLLEFGITYRFHEQISYPDFILHSVCTVREGK